MVFRFSRHAHRSYLARAFLRAPTTRVHSHQVAAVSDRSLIDCGRNGPVDCSCSRRQKNRNLFYTASEMAKKTKVLIIGAGAAGIAAASRLLEQGIDDFIVLEATNRIGGRINTVNFADNVVDLGAQWVHGETMNIVYSLASQHNLFGSFSHLFDPEKHIFFTINGEMIPKEEGAKALEIYNTIGEKVSNANTNQYLNLGDFFVNEYYTIAAKSPFTSSERTEEFLSWIEKVQSSIDCSDTWFDVSFKRLMEYHNCEGDSLLNWKDRGYKTVFDLLMRNYPNSREYLPVMEKIDFEKVVKSIEYNASTNEDVIVTTRDGIRYFASYVILTVSLGVLKDVYSNMFIPPLPHNKQLAIKTLNIGTADKIFLEFPHSWWPKDMASFNFLWSDKDKNLFLQKYGQTHIWICHVSSFYTVDYQPNVLCAWIVGKYARKMETLPNNDIFNGLCLLLERTLGKHYPFVLPKQMLVSRWHTNEHFRGSYSFQSMNSDYANVGPKDLAEPITKNNKPIIFFAGEATHSHYYSTVHGAIETGFREADRLIKYDQSYDD